MTNVEAAATNKKPVEWFVRYEYGPGLSMVLDQTYPTFDAAFAYVWAEVRKHGGMTKAAVRAHLADHWANYVSFPPLGDGYSIDYRVVRAKRQKAGRKGGTR